MRRNLELVRINLSFSSALGKITEDNALLLPVYLSNPRKDTKGAELHE